MKKISIINRQVCKELKLEIEQVLSKLAEKHGLTFEMGRGSFDSAEFHNKFILRTASGEKSVELSENNLLAMYGLKLDAKVRMGGKILTICGYKQSAPKRPIQLIDGNGRKFVASIASCKRSLVVN